MNKEIKIHSTNRINGKLVEIEIEDIDGSIPYFVLPPHADKGASYENKDEPPQAPDVLDDKEFGNEEFQPTPEAPEDWLEEWAKFCGLMLDGSGILTLSHINKLREIIHQLLASSRSQVVEMIEEMKGYECKISETGWSSNSEGYRKQMEKYGTDKYNQALSDLLDKLK